MSARAALGLALLAGVASATQSEPAWSKCVDALFEKWARRSKRSCTRAAS